MPQINPFASSSESDGQHATASPKKPVVVCAVMINQSSGETHAYTHGATEVDTRGADPIKRILIESARAYCDRTPPPRFTLLACEVFYREGIIDEVRMAGTYFSTADEHGMPRQSVWSTSEMPRLTNTRTRIVLDPADEGRSYIAACRLGDDPEAPILFAWDVVGNAEHCDRDDVEACMIALSESGAGVLAALSDVPEGATLPMPEAMARIAPLMEGCSLEEIKSFLLPREPVDAGGHRNISVDTRFGRLSYAYDVRYTRYYLAHRYATSVVLSEQELAVFVDKLGLTESEGRAALLLTHLHLREKFAEDSLAVVHEQIGKMLDDTAHALVHEPDTVAMCEWADPDVVLGQDPNDLKKTLAKSWNDITKQRIATRGKGRPKNSRTTKTDDETQRLHRQYEASIVAAMKSFYSRLCEAAEGEHVDEGVLTRIAVAAEINLSRTTLNEWLQKAELDFDELKTRVLRMFAGKYG